MMLFLNINDLKLFYFLYKIKKMNKYINFSKIKWNCHHLHLDKSQTLNTEILKQSQTHMTEKWKIIRKTKQNYTVDDLKRRMLLTTNRLVEQGCYNMRTHLDVDQIVGLLPMIVALDVKSYWKNKGVNLQIGTQLLEPLKVDKNRELFYEAAEMADFIGCLPSRDGEHFDYHLDVVFSKAKELNKDVEVHTDQQNIPTEKETERVLDFVEKYSWEGRTRTIHCISLACQPLDYQIDIAKRLAKLDVGVICCPSAAVSMTQHTEMTSPIHNSIAPVRILKENGVNVSLGVDNVEDLLVPFCNADLQFEIRLLAEACRIYDIDMLTDIITNDMGF